MPYLAGYEIYDNTATGTSHTIPVPSHAANDILVACLNADGSNAPQLPTSTGGGTWVSVRNQANIGGQSFRLAYLVCTSAAETCTSALSAGETMAGVVCCVKGNGGTLAYDTSAARTTDDSAEPFAGIAITPGVTNTLLLQFLTSDGGIGPMLEPPYRNIAACDTAANSVGGALMYPLTTSEVTAKNWYSGAAVDNTMACAITLKDDGSEDRVSAYLDPTSVVTYHYNGGNANKNGVTWDAATPLPLGAIIGRDFTQMWEYDGTSTYTDKTTDITDVGTADVSITNATDAIWYFGYELPFENMVLSISTAQSGGTIVWEYYTGSAWATLTVSGVLTATGWVNLTWTLPSDWASTAVNSVTKYYVRMRVTAIFSTAPILSQGGAGGALTAYDAVAAAADSHFLPYANSSSFTPVTSSSLALSGCSYVTSSAHDMDTGVLILHHRAALARDYLVDPCKGEQDYPFTAVRRRHGILIGLVDADGEYEFYTYHSKGSLSNSANDFNTAVIGLNDSATPALMHGTLNKSAVTDVYFVCQPQFGDLAWYVCNWLSVGNIVLAGGGVGGANPIGFDELVTCINNSLMYSNVMQRAGDVVKVYVPLQFGGGDHCNIALDGKTFVWPNEYDGQLYHDYNGADDVLNLILYGQDSDDSFEFTNCVFKAGQPHTWGFHASHSADAVLDFAGTIVDGFNVVLRSTVTLDDAMTFRNCPSFILNGATVSNVSFINTKVSAASPGEADNVSDCSFTKTTGTQHAIEIGGTAANITLSGLTFTGYATSDGSTGNEAIYVNIASGSMTISISGGGDTPSIRTAGATVTVQNLVTLSVTVLDAVTKDPIENARVFLETDPGGTDLMNELTNSSGIATENYNFTGAQAITGRVRKASSSPFYRTGDITGTITSSGFTATVLLISDEG